MKYRVKKICIDDDLNAITALLFFWLIPFLNTSPTWEIQYKKHWWNKWKTCDSYDNIEDAYRNLLQYKTNNKCTLPEKLKFKHNKIEGKYVWGNLIMGKIAPLNKKYNEGKHYYAGYKPNNYARFYYCAYGKSYEDAINKLWSDLEIHKLISKNGTS